MQNIALRKTVANHAIVGFEDLSQSPTVPVLMGLTPDAVIRVPYGSQRLSSSITAERIAELIADVITPTKGTVYVVAELSEQEQQGLHYGLRRFRDLALMADIVMQTEHAVAIKLEEHRKQNGEDVDHAVVNVIYLMPLPEGWLLDNYCSLIKSDVGIQTTVLQMYRTTDIIDISAYPVLSDFEKIPAPTE